MINLTVKLNNQETSGTTTVRVVNGRPVVSWSYDPFKFVETDEYGLIEKSHQVEQHSFELIIGTSSTKLGSSLFVGNVRTTGVVHTVARSWAYTGVPLERGVTYYGQIKVRDNEDNFSEWKIFSFHFNSVPVVSSVVVSPSVAGINDDLVLSYDFLDTDGDIEQGTLVKWFKDSVHQRQFDNQTTIPDVFTSYGDLWSAYVFPGDGFELGSRVESNVATISTTAPTNFDVIILPTHPDVNDILKADYKFSGSIDSDKSRINWYLNDELMNDFNDQQFVRLDVEVGDQVRFEIQPFDGVSFGDVVASKTVAIASSEFIVENIKVEGQLNPLSVLSLKPLISWDVLTPPSRPVQYISIKIGTFAGGDNIFSIILNSRQKTFAVPSGSLDKGTDYYVSVAVSDVESFNRYTISHFRTSGSLWSEKASNSTGWTIETVFNNDGGTFDRDLFQIIRIQDGTRFGEIRIYSDRLSLFSKALSFSSAVFDFTRYRIMTIVGKGDDVKVYLDRVLVLDGTGLLVQDSSDKRLEFGAFKSAITIRYQSFYYTINGAFHPGTDSEFNDLQFHELASFPLSQALGLKSFLEDNVNKKVLAINPDEDDEGGSVFSIVPGSKNTFGATLRTFSPINNVEASPNDLFKVFSHARGASIFKSYLINDYDHSIDFVSRGKSGNPVDNNWELVQDTGGNKILFINDGLEIKTI